MASADAEEPAPLLQEIFTIQGKLCTVTLTPDVLKWQSSKGKKQEEVAIRVEEILSVTAASEKAKAASDSILRLAYIRYKKGSIITKGKLLSRTTAKLTGNHDVCSRLLQNIQECISKVAARPRSALVLINPISGARKGQQLYQDKVAPVFTEAAVKTEVIVTESAKHVKEIIDGYDLTSIDSLVTVGGDGMYHLVADALMQRFVRQAGLHLNDSEVDIPEITLPIGIIPCGTGNGIALSCYGGYDVESAALAIVRGGQQKHNLHCIWCGGEFLVYSSFFQGWGVMADIIYETSTRRNMGRLRYPVVLGSFLFKRSLRVLDLTIEYRPPVLPPPSSAVMEEEMDKNTSQSWQTYQGRGVLLMNMLWDMIGYNESRDPTHMSFSRCFVDKQWGPARYLKFFLRWIKLNPALLHDDNMDHMPVQEFKVKLNNPEDQGGREHLINIDGEVYRLNKPEFHVKIFPGKVNLFASEPEDIRLSM